MFQKLTTFLAVTAAAFALMAPSHALAKNPKSGINSLRKQLNSLPKQKVPFSKVKLLVAKLAKLDPKHAPADLRAGLVKISYLNAVKNATALTRQVNTIVEKAKTLSAREKSKIVLSANRVLQKYVPPFPPGDHGPYQAALRMRPGIA